MTFDYNRDYSALQKEAIENGLDVKKLDVMFDEIASFDVSSLDGTVGVQRGEVDNITTQIFKSGVFIPLCQAGQTAYVFGVSTWGPTTVTFTGSFPGGINVGTHMCNAPYCGYQMSMYVPSGKVFSYTAVGTLGSAQHICF